MIHRSMDRLQQFTGIRPVGWLGPGLTQTLDTPDLLAEAGVRYIGDWVWDDEPCAISTAHGPLVTMPYTVELNDIPTMIVQHHESAHWATRCLDTLDRLHQEGAERAKIMAIAIHPYISGQPHRIRHLEQVLDAAAGRDGVVYSQAAPDISLGKGDQLHAADSSRRTNPSARQRRPPFVARERSRDQPRCPRHPGLRGRKIALTKPDNRPS